MAIKVNGIEVPAQAIEHELRLLVQFYSRHMPGEEVRKRMDELQSQAKEQAIGTQLLLQEAAELKIPVSEAEIDEAVSGMTCEAGGEEALEALLQRQGLTRDDLRRSIRKGKRLDKLVARIVGAIPDPGEEDLRAYFEAHPEQYSKPERALAQHILVQPQSAGDEDRDKARRALLDLRDKCRNGASFSDLAAAHSECPSGRKTGGSLGWVSRGSMVPEFEDALFALPVGGISDVIETPLGFHIILKAGHEKNEPASFEDARDDIRNLVLHNLRGRKLSEHVAELRKNATVEEE